MTYFEYFFLLSHCNNSSNVMFDRTFRCVGSDAISSKIASQQQKMSTANAVTESLVAVNGGYV